MDLTVFNWAYGDVRLTASYVPNIIAAIVVLLIGWIVGTLLGKGVRIILDKIHDVPFLQDAPFTTSFKNAGLTIGYIGDIGVRALVYITTVIAAVDILNVDYLNTMMNSILDYIPHIVAFLLIIIVGFLLVHYFIDTLANYYAKIHVDYMPHVLFVLRILLYFLIAVMGLSELQLDLTIIYTFLTPIAWGVGIGLGAGIAILIGFGLKDRSRELMDRFIESMAKK